MLLEMNDKATKSYSQVVQANLARPVEQPTSTQETMAEKSTISLLDEYADRNRRKCNLVIHNMPESTADNLADRIISDVAAVIRLVEIGLNIEGVKITKVIRLGGRGQNRQNKPRLILATMANPVRKRAILAAAKTLYDPDEWGTYTFHQISHQRRRRKAESSEIP